MARKRTDPNANNPLHIVTEAGASAPALCGVISYLSVKARAEGTQERFVHIAFFNPDTHGKDPHLCPECNAKRDTAPKALPAWIAEA